jgi:hypothetical protein
MANTRIGRTVSSAGDRKKATFSAWVKRAKLGESWIAKFGGNYSQGNYMQIGFDDNDGCFIIGDIPSGSTPRMQSTRKFRDTSAWYHYVVAFDTTQSTASNRLKFYINGEQVTSFGTATYPTLNLDLGFNRTGTYNNAWLGGRGESTYEFSGLMSHVHWCDGYVYDASAFGETDATTGEWKIKTSPSVTYGTNGYFMLKDGNSLTDASGNNNNFSSLVGTLTKTEDSPSNVFATLNPLNVPTSNAPTFSNGNNTSITSSATGSYKWGGSTTLGMTSGKFYCEAKATVDSTYSRSVIGITGDSTNLARTNGSILGTTASCGYYSSNGSVQYNGSGDISGFNTSYTTGDIISMAFDLDNGKLYFRKNNDAWLNSGNPTSGATGTGAVSILSASTTSDGAYFFAQTDDTGTSSPSKFEFNFGNGYFATTAVASAGTNASGNGIFEHDVPTGYTALSTKGLNL